MKQYLKKLIENNELEQAIEQLFELYALGIEQEIGENIEEYETSLILISSNYSRTIEDLNKGVITYAEADPLKARAVLSLLTIVNDLPDEILTIKSPPEYIDPNQPYQDLSSESKEKIDQPIYLKCDRIQLRDDLEIVLNEMESTTKPFVFFLPGFYDDHFLFAVKKMILAISNHFDTPLLEIKAEAWSVTKFKDKQFSIVQKYVKESFEQALKNKHITDALPNKLKNALAFVDIPILKEYILLFEQEIDLKYWTDATYQNLSYFLNTFWNIELEEDRKPIFIVYTLKNDASNPHDRSIIEKIQEEFNNESINLFEDLSEISREHIVNFYEDCNIFDAKDFMKDDETRRLRNVLDDLRKVLIKHKIHADEDAIANL